MKSRPVVACTLLWEHSDTFQTYRHVWIWSDPKTVDTFLDHSTRGSEEDGELSTGTQHSLTRLSHTTQLENACHLLWSSQLLSESVRNHSEQKDYYYFSFRLKYFSPQLRSRVSRLREPECQRSVLTLNKDIRYYRIITNQVFLTFAHLSTFRTGCRSVSLSLSLSLSLHCLHLKRFNIKQRYFLKWRLVLVILYCTIYTVHTLLYNT